MVTVCSRGAENSAVGEPLGHPSPTWRLPVELLLQCLMAADMVTRIHASHVCHAWREAALAERRIWDNFSCLDFRFRSQQHEDAMFSLLQTMLLRSRPLPFHLTIPYSHGGIDSQYRKPLLALEAFDVHRLAAYNGPAHIFEQLNPSRAPLPNLACLGILDLNDSEPYPAAVEMEGRLGSGCLPNLQELSVQRVRFPTDCAPFLSLQSITLGCMRGIQHRPLFVHCPGLIRLEIADCTMGTPLPDPPVPPSLREVSIRCARTKALDITILMRYWRGVHVRRVAVREVYSLQGVLPLFIASHTHPIELRLVGDDAQVALAEMPEHESVWTLFPSSLSAAGFLASIEKPTSERLTSVCVAFSRLGALFRAQLHMPGLERLELRVNSAAESEDTASLQTGSGFFLRAPRLRSVFFNFGDDCGDSLEDALSVLRASFRTLLEYDTDLLDTITVSRHAERLCSGFAPFAKVYQRSTYAL